MEGPNYASQNIQPELPALTAAGEHPNQSDSRPSSPAGNELLPVSSTFATAEIPPDLLDYDETSSLQGDEQMQMIIQDHGYNSSASSAEQSSSDILARDLEDEKLVHGSSRSSSHSSVSSIPASVLVHSPAAHKTLVPTGAHQHYHDHRLQRSHYWDDCENAAYEKTPSPLKSIDTIRRRDGAFRKPSSVRAMQMHTEDESDDQFLTPPRRRGGQRHSDTSLRSPGSSALKRSPYYSPNGSASKQKVKKEYPLVLLHCTLLPPSLPVVGLTRAPNQKILKDVLPREYWRRWKLLEEKIGSGVLRDRGVLISHPEDTYDLLEERLLESLELQHPRLHHGHFIGQDENDSDKEDDSGREDSATDDEQGEVCPDCGGRVIPRNNQGRKWEIKVFAANGLMRAGAWAAAWKEMEKVDVEVGLWLPSDVRSELERRLLEDESISNDNYRLQVPQLNVNEPSGDLDTGSHPPMQRDHTRNSSMDNATTDFTISTERHQPSVPASAPAQRQERHQDPSTYNRKPTEEIDLQTLLVNYIRVLANDRRNVAITLLSIVVVFFAIGSARNPAPVSELRPFPHDMFDSASSPVGMAQQQHPSATLQNAVPSWSASTEKKTEDVSSSIPTSVVRLSQVPAYSEKSITGSESTATMAQESSTGVDNADNQVPSPEDPGTSDNPDHTIAAAVETQEPVSSQDATTLEPLEHLESSEVEPISEVESGPGMSSDSTHVDDSTDADHNNQVLPSTETGEEEAQPESIEPVEPGEDPGDGASH